MVHGVDTDVSPYDSGSYASSTAYLTGGAVVKTCDSMIEKILEKGAEYLEAPADQVNFDGKKVYRLDGTGEIRIKDIGNRAMCGNGSALEVTESNTSPTSPPPFMAVSYTHLAAQTALNQPITREKLLKQMEKTGGTPFEFQTLEAEISGRPFLPVQALNELRPVSYTHLDE